MPQIISVSKKGLNDQIYRPFGAATQIMSCKLAELLIEGPAGTGKTRAVCEKAHLCAQKYPKARILFVRKTRVSMSQSVLVTFENYVAVGSSVLEGATRNNRRSYLYPNGSEIVLGGIDQISRIMSSEYDMICAFEATELIEDEWEKLLTRLRNGKMPYQQGICDCNPDRPTHWLNQRAAIGKMRRFFSRHQDNPTITPEYLSTLQNLTGARRLRLYEGKWAMAEGLVYPAFDPAMHLISPFPVPQEWRKIRAIDFGYTNPFICQWWAIDNDGRMYLYRELYRTKTLVEDNAKEIKRLENNESIECTVADHDAEDRATLERYGIYSIPAMKHITPGIEAVNARLRKIAEQPPRLFIMRNALVQRDELLAEAKKPFCTEQEFDNYIYPESKYGRNEKEEPVKVDDHGMDAMRYAVAFVDGLGYGTLDVKMPEQNHTPQEFQTGAYFEDERPGIWDAA